MPMPCAFGPPVYLLLCVHAMLLVIYSSCSYGVVCLVLCFRASSHNSIVCFVLLLVMWRIIYSTLNSIICFCFTFYFRPYGVSPSPPLLDIVPDNQHLVIVFSFILS